MDKNYVKSVIEDLKSSSSNRVQECLLKIRSKITVNDHNIKLFHECGGLEYLVPHLRKPNERILDLSLSVLGNCCLEEECNLAVGKLNAFGSLVTILKNVCKDSIVGRACRLIGNLAQKNVNAEHLHNHGAVAALINLIEKRDRNTSYPTLTMAVRAIRQLWMVIDKREEMLSLNAVRCIAILLTTECESANIIKSSKVVRETDGLRKSQEELITGILKCLGYYTTHPTVQCAEQIQGDGRGYQCLVALTKIYESLALKCLMNLCFISSCRPLLGTAGMVECLVGILKKISEVPWWPEGAARALAQLSGESVNRSRLRHAHGLPLLLAAAKTSPHAMHALLQYVFDDSSFQILVNEGLISLLTEELSLYINTMDYQHNYTENVTTPTKDTNTKPATEEWRNIEAEQVNTPQCPNDESCLNKGNLFTRRKQSHLISKNEDELRVVIERDNMIVGFVDAVDSDASDDSESDNERMSPRRYLKRARSGSPKTMKKKSQLIKMASKDWSASVYWEPKSPEWPTNQQQSKLAMSPDRLDQSPLSPYSEGNQSGFSPDYRSAASSKRARWDWSPESGVSTGEASSSSPYWTEYQWSPSSSGHHSPFSGNDDSSDSEMSGRYSPVCSEVEGEAAVNLSAPGADLAALGADLAAPGADLAATQVAHHLDDLVMDDDSVDDESPHDDPTNKIDCSSKSSRIACVLVLLFRVSHGACSSSGAIREEPVSNHTLDFLTGKECLYGLLDYVERCKRPLGRAARILIRVLRNALCLMNILKNRLALRLHSMSVTSKHPTTKCLQCKQIVWLSAKLLAELTILAESSYGIGEISYQLLKGNPSIQETLSLSLPYIVKNQKPLKKYFIDCSALNILFTIISDSKEEIQDCVVALAKLASNVQIKDPKTLENRFKDQISVSYDPILDNLSVEEIVTFELDDSSVVKANKVFLCQNSEVFSAMLMGCFKESVQECVRLRNVTKEGLEYLLTLLHCGLNNSKTEIQVFPMADKLEVNLEVLLLADRFLFEKLKGLLSSAIMQFQMTPQTAAKIYMWSLSEGMGFLCVESVAYLLTGKMCDTDRTQSFKTILNMEYKEQWLDDIKNLILRQLAK